MKANKEINLTNPLIEDCLFKIAHIALTHNPFDEGNHNIRKEGKKDWKQILEEFKGPVEVAEKKYLHEYSGVLKGLKVVATKDLTDLKGKNLFVIANHTTSGIASGFGTSPIAVCDLLFQKLGIKTTWVQDVGHPLMRPVHERISGHTKTILVGGKEKNGANKIHQKLDKESVGIFIDEHSDKFGNGNSRVGRIILQVAQKLIKTRGNEGDEESKEDKIGIICIAAWAIQDTVLINVGNIIDPKEIAEATQKNLSATETKPGLRKIAGIIFRHPTALLRRKSWTTNPEVKKELKKWKVEFEKAQLGQAAIDYVIGNHMEPLLPWRHRRAHIKNIKKTRIFP